MEKIAVYTCICGDYDNIIEQTITHKNADFYCFTDDKNKKSNLWNIIDIKKYTNLYDCTLINRFFKWNPHIFFSQYKYSLYIDGNLEIISPLFWKRISDLIERNCKIAIAKHPFRKSIYEEGRICIKYRKDNPEKIKHYLKYIQNCNHFKNDNLLYQNGLVFREHNNNKIIEFDTKIYELLSKFTKRDQLILPYVRQNLKITIEDFNYGKKYPLFENPFFGILKVDHEIEDNNIFKNELLFSILTSKKFKAINSVVKTKNKLFFIPNKLRLIHKDVLKNLFFAAQSIVRKKNIIFLYNHNFSNTASTILRVFQLVDILRSNLPNYNIFATPIAKNLKNSLIVVTKSALSKFTEFDISDLKRNNNILIYDPIDSKIGKDKIAYSDIILASSHAQFNFFKNIYINKNIYYFTHNVDKRIKKIIHSDRQALFAYFGELENTMISERIKKHVDFINIDTKNKNKKFISYLKNYNIHYAIRRDNGDFKPFTKGFVAARSCSNIIIQKSTYDVINYLPEDYPFLVNTTKEQEILDKIIFAKQEFMTTTWNYALDCMKYIENITSDKYIANEFKNILHQIKY